MNGKWCGRKRVTTLVGLEEAAHEGVQRPLQVAHVDGAVDHQALHLVEHRRVGGVAVAAIDAAGPDDADRRRLVTANCGAPTATLARASPAPGSGWCGCAAACARRPRPGFRKKVSCISRAGWRGGKLRPVKLWKSSSMSGPSATAKPISAKMAIISSITCMVGCTAALAARRRGQGEVDAGRRRGWASSAGVLQLGLARGDRRRRRGRAGR